MPRQDGFENKRVVIVGGSSGIGLAVAEQVALQGAEVVIVSSNAARVQDAVKSIGGKAQGQAVDVSDEKALESFFTNLVPLITWFSPQVTACNCTSLLRRSRKSTDSKGWFRCPHNWNRWPAAPEWMGNRRKCLWNYRSPNPCLGD